MSRSPSAKKKSGGVSPGLDVRQAKLLGVPPSRRLDVQESRRLDGKVVPAALYLRVSTDAQTNDNQRGPLADLAEARGWTPVWYEDVGSGAVRVRPALHQLQQDARAGRLRAVAVVALDRLGRNMRDVIDVVTDLDRCGCQVLSLREPWLDTGGPARSLLLAVFGWVAEQERALLVERTRAGLARAKRQGTKSGKPIGRPKANRILLGNAARLRQTNKDLSLRAAAKKAGVSPSSLRRYLAELELEKKVHEKAAAELVEAMAGGGVRQNPPSKPAPRSAQKSRG